MARRGEQRPTERDEESAALSYDRFPSGWGWGWPPAFREDASGEPVRRGDSDAGEDRWESGLVSLLLVGGVVLVVFPEPATSLLGIVLVLAGVVAWLAGR